MAPAVEKIPTQEDIHTRTPPRSPVSADAPGAACFALLKAATNCSIGPNAVPGGRSRTVEGTADDNASTAMEHSERGTDRIHRHQQVQRIAEGTRIDKAALAPGGIQHRVRRKTMEMR